MRRRTFLLAGLGAGGALAFGWSLRPPRQRLHGGETPQAAGAVALSGWLLIGADDTVTVVTPKAEMGQGIHTALAMLVAEELEVPWERVRVTHSPIDPIYYNVAAFVDAMPLHANDRDAGLVRTLRWFGAKIAREAGLMTTAGSSSVRDVWDIARLAGATARVALVETAAARAGVPVASCTAQGGVVRWPGGEARYGALAADAATRRPRNVALKAPAAFRLIGHDVPRVDVRAKSRGATTYGIDLQLEGMLHAAVAMPPTFGATPVRFDADATRALPGVRHVFAVEGGARGNLPAVAVVADTWWHARQALPALNVQWSAGPHASPSSDSIMTTLRSEAKGDGGWPFRSKGSAVATFEGAARTVEATYEAPYLAHAAMEPLSATARVTTFTPSDIVSASDSAIAQVMRVEVWAATQVPQHARAAVAELHGIAENDVTLHEVDMGGSFGRRLDIDFILQATQIAAAVPDVPVKLIWSREDDMRHDFLRPAAVSQWRAGFDARGALTSVIGHTASQAPFKAVSKRVGIVWTAYGPDRYAGEGAWDQPYEFPSVRFAHREVDLPVPVGSWRSVGHSLHGFFLESFIDELAHAQNADPLAYRLQLLAKHPRAAQVLTLAAERAQWGAPLAPADDGLPRARGIALHWMVDTVAAQVVEVSVTPGGTIRVHRVTCAVDCGLVVHPDGVRQQVEGAILLGLTAALQGEITIAQGAVRESNFHDYLPLRMSASPVIDVHIVPSGEVPSGVGEAALPPIAPAVANAVFALTGERLRALPLRPAVRPAKKPVSMPATAKRAATANTPTTTRTFTVNDAPRAVAVPDDTPLLWTLRESLGLTGTHYGCGVAQCGACTVHVNGVAMRSCMMPASAVGPATITTIEGVHGPIADAVRDAWEAHSVPQCGYCQAGQIMSAISLLSRTPAPTDTDIDRAMDGNICRCGTYPRIRAAIHTAAQQLAGVPRTTAPHS